MRHPVLKVKPRAGRRARAGAPWIFSNEIEMSREAKALPPGALVTVEGPGHLFGTGYFNPASLIAARLLAPERDAAIDAAFFMEKIGRALALREQLYVLPCYRLVNAEGDRLPGLVIDRFANTLAVQITTAGMEALRAPLLEALQALIAPETIVLRNDTPSRALEGLPSAVELIMGEAGRVALEENAVRYFAEPASGQKTGWYYDQRENRAFMAMLAGGRRVLDLYCHTGGFALVAAAERATVTAIDSSAPALELAREAAEANALSDLCRFEKADVFEALQFLRAAGERFEVVIADPPPFVKAKKDLEAGARAYRKLARQAAEVTAAEGFLFLASCSHNIGMERFAAECAAGIARAGRHARLIRQAGAGPDHPVHPALPESAYLKALVYALD